MTPITLSRFEKSARAFTFRDSYKGCLSNADDNCAPIESHMEGLIKQLKTYAD